MAKTKVKFSRSPAGFYTTGDWTIGQTEGEDRSPGYHWYAHNPEVCAAEVFFSKLSEAKTYVIREIQGIVK